MPTNIVFDVLLCPDRYKLSYRDIAEYFLDRGFEFTHETVRNWEERFLPLFTDQIRENRRAKVGKIWKTDETYVRIKGVWCYLYRGINENGNLDVRFKTRDMEGMKAFSARAREIAEDVPDRVLTDGLTSYPRAIQEELGEDVKHQVLPCTANPTEQSHQGIKQRYYPMLGFGEFEAAQRFCQAFDEVRNFLRPIDQMGGYVSLNERRQNFQSKISELKEIFLAA